MTCEYCSWVNKIQAKISVGVETKTSNNDREKQFKHPVIIVHGGAGSIPLNERNYMMIEVRDAAIKAYKNLAKGGSSLDAIETAICHMESKRLFNCAKGGSLDANGEVVTDAGIMNDESNAGCVGAVRDIEHPISLAKIVLQKTSHILLVEKGAQKFALDSGIPTLQPGWFLPEVTPKESTIFETGDHEEEEDKGSSSRKPLYDPENYNLDEKEEEVSLDEKTRRVKLPWYVTRRLTDEEEQRRQEELVVERRQRLEPTVLQVSAVGAVSFDRNGHLATGTSTAGEPRKTTGTISAIGTVPGCGIFADKTGCTSVSGPDKAIYTYAPARRIVKRMAKVKSPEDGLKLELDDFENETFEAQIGAVALNSSGESAVLFKSLHFPWAMCHEGWIYYGCTKDDMYDEEIQGLDRADDCRCDITI
ncbi:probable isoaspartyl peptidase/L-asparaginase CG7860 [Orussus abietinus]|uniref:probable isoaspartyl peptidase/L-asparaginase CG7860 n=1 Tax=Orussus abietinus TaxID=222816 RepID=UPI000626A8C6|nr:probable isoaspartyl peptidase/L-asparaginase CG7860 [Orussus abietinus]